MSERVGDLRRSQRVIFDMPVDVHIRRENENPTFEAAKTLSVNAHGALLALTTPVAFGEMLRLINPRTEKEIECRVCRFAMRYPNGVTHVGVEFAAAMPTFWDVPSLPPDWDPAWVPPAERMRLEPSLGRITVADTIEDAAEFDAPGVAADSVTLPDAKPNSRQSVRLPFEIPVVFYAHKENMGPTYEEGKTVSVSVNGALLAARAALDIGQSLLLINPKADTQIGCHVRSVDRGGDGTNYVGVEFAAASPEFWGVIFPSADQHATARNAARDSVPINVAPAEPLLESSPSEQETWELETQLPDIVERDTKLDAPAAVVHRALPSDTKPNSRRSTRLPFTIPVAVQAQEEDPQAFSAVGKTVQINVNGALLVLPASPSVGQLLLLTNSKTGTQIVCQVRSLQPNESGLNHVAVEFEAASPKFWGINFPPEDWDEADRKLPQRPLSMKAAPPKPSRPGTPSPPLTNLQKIIGDAKQEQHEFLDAGKANSKSTGWRAFKWPIIALAACVALFIIWISVRQSSEGDATAPQISTSAAGVAPADANIIPQLEGFRLATVEDFNPDAVSWLRGSGQEPGGEIPGAFTAIGQSKADVLVGKDAMWRIVILADGQLRCDAKYRSVALIARVPKQAIPNIIWSDPPPSGSEGDGLLVVRDAKDLGSGVVLLLRGAEVVSGTPSSYQQIPLREIP